MKPEMTKEQKLRGMVEMLVSRFFGPDGLSSSKTRLKLVNREMIEPTDVMEQTIIEKMLEFQRVGKEVFCGFLGEDLPAEKIHLLIISLVGQCAYPMFSTELLRKSGLITGPMNEFCKDLTEHVYEFTINALENMRSK
ncbi:CerR family C-terminal domain-containing protein [Seleniivibrio sp.]|uniref:CerR family C-terminal domain-containing protein n=1 Tax=Seleniivibrio sp. TaxID=2898801 RepID=UPI0025F38700|nr:CerR family C-terminal domain-containing protein [Seleniivibrio sp.]MCD8553871.1 DUF1956 domain-containing protein [Seleniivibrio sp.]